MKKVLSIFCALSMIAALFPVFAQAESDAVSNIVVQATSYQTNGILIPEYSFNGIEGESTYRWLMADTPDAAAEDWQEIAYENTNLSAKGKITADAAKDAFFIAFAKAERQICQV